jgi:hypothetical protein
VDIFYDFGGLIDAKQPINHAIIQNSGNIGQIITNHLSTLFRLAGTTVWAKESFLLCLMIPAMIKG